MKIRKNDKAYLQDFKIDIRAKSDLSFQELSLLFDKPAYLNMLPNLRRTYSVPNLISLEEYNESFPHGEPELWADEATVDLSKYTKLKELKKALPDFLDRFDKLTEYPIVLEYECYLLCYEFNRPPHFRKAIQQSIFCGIVTDEYFKPTEAILIDPDAMWFETTLLPVAILVTPTSTYEEVKGEFRKAKELMKTDKRLSYYRPRVDVTPNIRKYRGWYWERIKGKTGKQIADEWPNSEIVTDLDVFKAVKIYSQLLTR